MQHAKIDTTPHSTTPLVVGAAAVLLAATAAGLWMTGPSSEPGHTQAPSPPPPHPHGVHELLAARPFLCDEPFLHDWRAVPQSFDAGWLLVLEVDPEVARLRQVAHAVLYVGDQTAQRINSGESGRLVALVPTARGTDGAPLPVLDDAPIWFGTPELPERVDAARLAEERALADRAGYAPFDAPAIAQARSAGGATLEVARRHDLDFAIADWIEEHSPAEVDLVRSLRLR